jgi:hypothetical protein
VAASRDFLNTFWTRVFLRELVEEMYRGKNKTRTKNFLLAYINAVVLQLA